MNDNPYGYKLFIAFCWGPDEYFPVETLIQHGWNSLVGAPTATSHFKQTMTWQRWQISQNIGPFQSPIPDTDGRSYLWFGQQFQVTANYSIQRLFSTDTGVVSVAFQVTKHPEKDRTTITLMFGNYPGPPYWQHLVSEAIVLETMMHVAHFVRAAINWPQKPLFQLHEGAWVNNQLQSAPRAF